MIHNNTPYVQWGWLHMTTGDRVILVGNEGARVSGPEYARNPPEIHAKLDGFIGFARSDT